MIFIPLVISHIITYLNIYIYERSNLQTINTTVIQLMLANLTNPYEH